MKTSYLAAVCLSLVLLGCAPPPSGSNPSKSTTHPSVGLPDPTMQQPLMQSQADRLMTAMVDAINANQPEALVPYVWESAQSTEHMAQAIAHFKTLFHNEPITATPIQGNPPSDAMASEGYHYQLSGPTGEPQTITVQQQSGGIRLIHPFLFYSGYANRQLEGLITAVKTDQPEQLARTLSPDDIEYSPELAAEAIATYRQNFDPETLQYELVGLEPKQNQFVYRITGTKQNQPVEHTVNVVYGDGLVGLRDTFIPPMN